jgi:ubiquinone/menaquinone biosynthesis C-methylase UbiE
VQNTAQLVQAAYDQIAAGYDERWSVHIRAPQQRLTRELRLVSGMHVADLGCGTGVDTLEMAKLTAPQPVVAVDCSQKMLDEAQVRARARGLSLRTVCADAEGFVASADPESFDALSLRFCLAYLPWRDITPRLARLLRPEGRLGILTNLSTSTPQALAAYRSMVDELNVPDIAMPVPGSLAELTNSLGQADLCLEHQWTHSFQLWFATGSEIAAWLKESGFITHPTLSGAPEAVQHALWAAFAERIERFREPDGICLDFELAGVVAARTARPQ